jgi:Membrane proteins related to metalloendopeptidases
MSLNAGQRRLASAVALSLLALLSFAQAPLGPASGGLAPAAPSASPSAALVAPARIKQGDPLLAWLAVAAKLPEAPKARLSNAAGKAVARSTCFDSGSIAQLCAEEPDKLQDLPQALKNDGRLYGLLMALPADLPTGVYLLEAGEAWTFVAVERHAFPLETIKLNQANTELRTVPSPRKDEEARSLLSLLGSIDSGARYAGEGGFILPAEGGWRSANFGDRRRYIYSDGSSDTTVHAGDDLAVVVGTPVHACARGRVALVADREVTGWTVVLEHLPGLYSEYMHLSKVEVAEGDVVEKGQLVALSGCTGLATGPHLHWEVRANGEPVAPDYWLGQPLLDKAAIMNKLIALIEGR